MGLGFRVLGLVFMGLGFKVLGLGFRASGLRFRVQAAVGAFSERTWIPRPDYRVYGSGGRKIGHPFGVQDPRP